MSGLTIDNLKKINKAAQLALDQVQEITALEAWRIEYLGRKGIIPALLRNVKNLSPAERRAVGQAGNEIRLQLQQSYQAKASALRSLALADNLDAHKISPTVPQTKPANHRQPIKLGHLHPMTITIRRLTHILSDLGFIFAEGPLVETPSYAFDFLNIPVDHPARGMMDTFYLENSNVMRPHTSPVQIRAVLENHLTPPFKIFSPGRVFRAEKVDATHGHTFYQFEGLSVGEDVSIANFIWTVKKIYADFFAAPVSIRLRPSYFPFVEPGFEVDISCVFCQASSHQAEKTPAPVNCRICKNSRWLEIMGAGMVHPVVLKNMNVDPSRYQGFAFGGAIDRLTMLRYNIDDIRHFWSGDLKFLRQF